MTWLKILAPVVLAIGLLFGFNDWRALGKAQAETKICIVAVRDLGDLGHCPKPIADAATEARAARSCDTALRDGDDYTVSKTCSAGVKKRDAEAAAALHDVANLKSQLLAAEASQAAAVDRASARAITTNQRKTDARDAIVRAPAGRDGTAVCDAGCLRALTGK